MSVPTIASPANSIRSILGHVSLLRLDRSVNQIFKLPGIVIAASLTGAVISTDLYFRAIFGLATAVVVVTSFVDLPRLVQLFPKSGVH